MVKVVSVRGESRESRRRKIYEMEAGETGWAVEWAYDEETGELNPKHTIHPEKRGTATMRVICVVPGEYKIGFE